MTIHTPTTDAEIAATWEVMRQLRPHVAREDYVPLVRGLMESDGYRLAALSDDGEVRAVAGYRYMNMLYCGRLLSLDDFVTDERVRSRGYGRRLMDWLKAQARAAGCSQLQLISHVRREGAHRFYFREGLGIETFHFRAVLD